MVSKWQNDQALNSQSHMENFSIFRIVYLLPAQKLIISFTRNDRINLMVSDLSGQKMIYSSSLCDHSAPLSIIFAHIWP